MTRRNGGYGNRIRMRSEKPVDLLRVGDPHNLAHANHDAGGEGAGVIGAGTKGIGNAGVALVFSAAASDGLQRRVKGSGQLLLDLDVPDPPGAIVLLERFDLFAIGIEGIVIGEDWIALDRSRIGPVYRVGSVYMFRTFCRTVSGSSLIKMALLSELPICRRPSVPGKRGILPNSAWGSGNTSP